MRDVALGLAESTAGRTCVIITHDPDVFVTDFNVFLQDGRVADIGSHELLLARNTAYASLVTRFTREREEERSATEQGVAAKDAVLPGTRPAPPVTLNADFPQKVRLQ
jgi:ABC-type proline/glycine betaine transport system ATPase subunit